MALVSAALFGMLLLHSGHYLVADRDSAYFGPTKTSSELSQPPSASENLTLTGTLEGGAVCVRIRTDDGRVFSLSGLSGGNGSLGKRLTVSGRIALVSKCQQGQELRVENSTFIQR